METLKNTAILALAALVLTACEARDPVANDLRNMAALPESENRPPDEMTGAGDAEANSAATLAAQSAIPAAQIPAELRGRWSHTPAGCDADTPDAGALMVVTARELRFEGSTAIPLRSIDTSMDSIAGEFLFTHGEQAWTRFQSLELQDGQLVRTQSKPMESITYISCD